MATAVMAVPSWCRTVPSWWRLFFSRPGHHRCLGLLAAGASIRWADYGVRTMWQLDFGRTSLFNIHHCPYCGVKL